jgi:hypothetical protein
MVRSKAKVGGIMMTVAAIGGFICISIIYLLPGVVRGVYTNLMKIVRALFRVLILCRYSCFILTEYTHITINRWVNGYIP